MSIVKVIYPTYLDEFKCVGGICEDSCCVGWDVDIDKATYRQYFKVSDIVMKKSFQKNIYKNEDSYDELIDYGKVKLKPGKRCPFLDEENYCVIQKKLGEEYLSNVCSSFPRITNRIDKVYEISLNVSCPEAARIILLKKEGIDFKEEKRSLGKHIISSWIDSDMEVENSAVKYLQKIRTISIEIMKNRSHSFSERFLILGNFLEELQYTIDCETDNLSEYIKSFNINKYLEPYKKNTDGINIQVGILKNMISDLNVFSDVDSVSFKNYTMKTMEGLGMNANQELNDFANYYKFGLENHFEPFIGQNSFIFENYIVNFMFKNMFPFAETSSLFDGYIMLFSRFLMIRFYLIGIFNEKEESNINDVVGFIQSFSKTVEHHKTYLVKLLEYFHENELDNMEFIKTVLL